MRAGEFADGRARCGPRSTWPRRTSTCAIRSLYRILHAEHHRTGDKWCIYPMYDYAHGRCRTRSRASRTRICTLEFENHRPLYDWFSSALGIVPPAADRVRPAQPHLHGDDASASCSQLVHGGHVSGWDDPRMPTICGLRRRGYTPEAIRDVLRPHRRRQVRQRASTLACSKTAVREDLNSTRAAAMGVLRPLKVVIENYPDGPDRGAGRAEQPGGPVAGHAQGAVLAACSTSSRTTSARTRRRTSSAWRPGARCASATPTSSRAPSVVKDATGEVVELRCTYDPATRGGDAPDGRKVKGTHPLGVAPRTPSMPRCGCTTTCSRKPDPDDGRRAGPRPQPAVAGGAHRLQAGAVARRRRGRRAASSSSGSGYFCADSRHAGVWNRTVSLKDSWAKAKQKG